MKKFRRIIILAATGAACCWCLMAPALTQAATLSGIVADYNAAKVSLTLGLLTVPSSVMSYTATTAIPSGSQLTIALPAGFSFATAPTLSTSASGVSLQFISGGIGSQTVSFISSGGVIAASNRVGFASSFSIAGANALGSVTPVANALPMSWQFAGVDANPVSRAAFASDYGAKAEFLGTVQFVDISSPSAGTQWLLNGVTDVSTIVAGAIAVSAGVTDSATSTVPLLNPDGTPNTLSAADQAVVTLNGAFQGVGSVFSSSDPFCGSALSQASSLTPFSATISVPINNEVFFCLNASGQPLGVSDPAATGDTGASTAWFKQVSVAPSGANPDFVSGLSPNIEFGGYTCGKAGPQAECSPWNPPLLTGSIPTLSEWGMWLLASLVVGLGSGCLTLRGHAPQGRRQV